MDLKCLKLATFANNLSRSDPGASTTQSSATRTIISGCGGLQILEVTQYTRTKKSSMLGFVSLKGRVFQPQCTRDCILGKRVCSTSDFLMLETGSRFPAQRVGANAHMAVSCKLTLPPLLTANLLNHITDTLFLAHIGPSRTVGYPPLNASTKGRKISFLRTRESQER